MNHEELTKLFNAQKILDQHIADKHSLKSENLTKKRFLALFVELGELANETRCFKFWSVKQASARDVILEEYVDSIHFLLSIGLDLGFTNTEKITNHPVQPTQPDLTECFHLVIEKILTLKKAMTEENYCLLFEQYRVLGIVLGFSSNDMIDAYFKKNEVNFQRQETNY